MARKQIPFKFKHETDNSEVTTVEFQLTQLTLVTARPVFQRLIGHAPSVTNGALVRFVRNALGKDFEYFVSAFAGATMVKTPEGFKPLTDDYMEEYFTGRFDVLLEWLYASVELNFGSIANLLPKEVMEASSAMLPKKTEG